MDTLYRTYMGGLSGTQKPDCVCMWAESLRSLWLRWAGPWHLRHTSCLRCLQTVPTSQRLENALENLHRAFLLETSQERPGGYLVRALNPAMCSGLHTLSCRVSWGEFESPTEHLACLLLLFLNLLYLLYNSC